MWIVLFCQWRAPIRHFGSENWMSPCWSSVCHSSDRGMAHGRDNFQSRQPSERNAHAQPRLSRKMGHIRNDDPGVNESDEDDPLNPGWTNYEARPLIIVSLYNLFPRFTQSTCPWCLGSRWVLQGIERYCRTRGSRASSGSGYPRSAFSRRLSRSGRTSFHPNGVWRRLWTAQNSAA